MEGQCTEHNTKLNKGFEVKFRVERIRKRKLMLKCSVKLEMAPISQFECRLNGVDLPVAGNAAQRAKIFDFEGGVVLNVRSPPSGKKKNQRMNLYAGKFNTVLTVLTYFQ